MLGTILCREGAGRGGRRFCMANVTRGHERLRSKAVAGVSCAYPENCFHWQYPVPGRYRQEMKLDRFDQQILQLLQEDGRINNQDLADRIGLSPSPCLRRVRALEEAGLILGYRAHVDARKLGLTLLALIHISMDVHTPERFAHFEAEIAVVPEVLECLLITGQEADYQLKVIVRDMDHYQSLLLQRITRIAGVTGVHSSFVLRKVLDKTAVAVATGSS